VITSELDVRENQLILLYGSHAKSVELALADEGWCAPLLRLLTDPHTLNRVSSEFNQSWLGAVFRKARSVL